LNSALESVLEELALNRLLIFMALIIPFFGLEVQNTSHVVDISVTEEPYAGNSLCLPGAYLTPPEDCLALGPSTFITQMAEKGIAYPLKPLPTIPLDKELNRTPDALMKVSEDPVPVYPSMQDAIARNHNAYLPAGRKYLAISEKIQREDGVYYRLLNGNWVVGGESGASCCIYAGRFQGLLLREVPQNNFGWIIDISEAHQSPSESAPVTASLINEQVVQVYDVVDAENTTWYMIGFDQWVEKRWIRLVLINSVPPEGVTNNRWIEVNLEQQTLAVYDDGRLVFATLVATGMKPMYTRPGLFQVYSKKPVETMSGTFEADRSDYYYFENVPFTMYFDEARALHGAYWRTLLGYAPQSHGCVNLSVGDAHWLYDWANESEWVYVWDPSGKTPTDPSLYNKGGAWLLSAVAV
jgi:hypothetical protein